VAATEINNLAVRNKPRPVTSSQLKIQYHKKWNHNESLPWTQFISCSVGSQRILFKYHELLYWIQQLSAFTRKHRNEIVVVVDVMSPIRRCLYGENAPKRRNPT